MAFIIIIHVPASCGCDQPRFYISGVCLHFYDSVLLFLDISAETKCAYLNARVLLNYLIAYSILSRPIFHLAYISACVPLHLLTDKPFGQRECHVIREVENKALRFCHRKTKQLSVYMSL